MGAKSSSVGREREWELRSGNTYTLCVLRVESENENPLQSHVEPNLEWGWSIPNVEEGVEDAGDDDNLCNMMDSETKGWSTPSNAKEPSPICYSVDTLACRRASPRYSLYAECQYCALNMAANLISRII